MNASKGTEEYRVGEIFLSATPATEAQTLDNANKILAQLAQRRFVRRLCAAIFGSLDRGGRRRPRLGPARAAARRRSPTCSARCRPGAISNPIPVPGGFSIIAVQDTRKILTADPRDAVLSLKQVSIALPEGHDARARPSRSSLASPRRRRTSAAAAAPTRSRPTSTARSSPATRSRCATCRRRCSG